jgi:hypothetical protein
MTRTLHEIEGDFAALDALLEEVGGDLTAEEAEAAVDQWLESLGEERDAKLNGYARRIQTLEAAAEAKKAEERRLAAQRKQDESRADWLKGRLLAYVQRAGMQIRGKETHQVETTLFRFVETLNGGKQALTYLVPALDLPEELRTDCITITVSAEHETVWRRVSMLLHTIDGALFTAERTAKPVEEAVREALEEGGEEITRYVRLEPRGVRLAIR